AGPISPVSLEILREIAADRRSRDEFIDLFIHRTFPADVFSSWRLVKAAVRMLAHPGRRRGALGEAAALLRENIDRRLLAFWPRYDDKPAVDEAHSDHQPAAA